MNGTETTCAPRRNRSRALRSAFSLLELVVALTAFGLIVAGIFPLVVMQSRGVKRLENLAPSDKTWHLVPSSDGWVRKLGGTATVTFTDPGPPPPDAAELLPVDDSDPGYSETGDGWTTLSDEDAVGGSFRRHSADEGNPSPDAATWTLTGLTTGWYDVRLTWIDAPEHATDASYSIYDGTTLVGAYSLNQQLAPSGDVFDGRPWESLAAVFIQSGTVRVQLTAESNGLVAAAAVRLVPIQNVVSVLSFEHSLSSEELTARVLVDVQVP